MHYKLLTRDQLVESLEQQEREGHKRRIGDIWMQNGWMTRSAGSSSGAAQYRRSWRGRRRPPLPRRGPRAPPPAAGRARPLAEGAAGAGSSAAPRPRGPPPPARGPARGAPRAGQPPPASPRSSRARWRSRQRPPPHSGMPPRLRIHGAFLAPTGAHRRVEPRLLLRAPRRPPAAGGGGEGQLDFAYTLPGRPLPLQRLPAAARLGQRLRVISPDPPGLSDLGMPLDLALRLPSGPGPITGPTGSGKSSTLCPRPHRQRERAHHHRGPVEFVHRPAQCVINQRQVGPELLLARCARRAGPRRHRGRRLRDLEPSRWLTAAETGHLVLATLHAERHQHHQPHHRRHPPSSSADPHHGVRSLRAVIAAAGDAPTARAACRRSRSWSPTRRWRTSSAAKIPAALGAADGQSQGMRARPVLRSW